MRKPEKIRAVYSELRSLLGSEVPAGDLIKLAHVIVNAYHLDVDELSPFGRAVDSRALLYLALDEAFNDGGWKVLDFEGGWPSSIDDEHLNSIIIRLRVGRFLGSGWEYG